MAADHAARKDHRVPDLRGPRGTLRIAVWRARNNRMPGFVERRRRRILFERRLAAERNLDPELDGARLLRGDEEDAE